MSTPEHLQPLKTMLANRGFYRQRPTKPDIENIENDYEAETAVRLYRREMREYREYEAAATPLELLRSSGLIWNDHLTDAETLDRILTRLVGTAQ